MAFPSHFHMPGSFHDGVHPGLFRPPVSSPSSSTDYLSSSAFASESGSKRKWSRSNVPRVHQVITSDGLFDAADVYMGTSPSSPPESRAYALAGQLDTPITGPADDDTDMMGESMFSDSDYRRALGSKRSRDEVEDAPVTGPTPLFNPPEAVQPSQGWGSFAFAAIGGVVGRVWTFCKSSAFTGFNAGGGTTYKMTSSGAVAEGSPVAHARPDGTFYYSARQEPANHYFESAQNVPGYFPESQPQYYRNDESPCSSGASTPTGPAAKRRHTDHINELGRNWVMIQEPSGDGKRASHMPSASSRASSRARKQPVSLADRRIATPSRRPASVMSNSTPRRPASRTTSRPGSRLSEAAALRPAARPASAASVASFSGSVASTPSRIPVKAASTASVASPSSASSYSQARPRRNSTVPTPSEPPVRRTHRRTNSAASTASNRGNDIENSPRLDAEAKQLATRRKKEERNTDVRMAAFNKRLQDMIRQGKEALGTTIEVDVQEGGWEDDI